MSCPYKVKECKCSGIKMEVSSGRDVDILFITEFPGKNEVKEKKFLSGSHGKFFREILSNLKEKTGFSYGITGVTRSESKPGVLVHSSPEVTACLNVLKKDIEKCNPRIIILLGNLPYSVFSKNHRLPKHGSSVEDGRLMVMNIFDKKYPVVFCQHPTWYLHNEACSVGFLYESIRVAIEYCQKKINPNIPNAFESVTLTSLKEVKEVLSDISQVPDFVAVDTEGTSLSRVYGNTLLSVQLSVDGKTGYVIPYLHKDSPFLDVIPKLRKLLINFFFEGNPKTLGYVFVNAKYDYHQFFREMKRFTFNAPVIDTSFGEFSLEENLTRVHSYLKGKGPYSLFTMSYKRGFRFYSKTDSKEKREILDKIPLKEWQEYAGADVTSPWHIFKKQIQKAERTNYREGFLFLNCLYENNLIRCLTYAEHCGLSINAERVKGFLQSNSTIKSGLAEITKKFYELPTVQEANARLSKGQTGIATGLAGTVKNWSPSSPKHRELLYFDIMGLDPVDEDDDGDNSHTGKNFQNAYAGTPEVDLLKEYSSFDKMLSGFIKPMAGYLDKTSSNANVDMYMDSRARPTFYPLAVTGRVRAAKPNSQQRPAGRSTAAKEILSMYEPKKGRVIVKLDYATFEVKGSGFLSGDKAMIKSFQEMHKLKEQFRANRLAFVEEGYNLQLNSLAGVKDDLKKKKKELLSLKGIVSKSKYKEAKEEYLKELEEYKKEVEKLNIQKEKDPISLSKSYVTMLTDSHRKFASLFYNVMVTAVSKPQRQSAKTLVFGLLYGMSIQTISRVLKITEEEGLELQKKYMKSFPYAARWLEQSKKFARKNLYIQSPIGRRRRLWGYLRNDRGVAGKMDRYAGNTIIQGFCSDCNIMGGSLLTHVIEAHNKLKYQVPDAESWELTNLIHDSCEFELPLEDAYYFIKEMEKIFTDYLTLYVNKVFGFKIEIPLEVDFTIGTNYGNTRDWDGSEDDLIDAMKWLCEETAKRDKTDVVDYKKLVKTPLYKKYPKGYVLDVVKKIIRKDMNTVSRLNLTKGMGGKG